jgi:hypothetical protein
MPVLYRNRCLVCEVEMRRKREDQRFKIGHNTCKKEYQRFPGVYDPLESILFTTRAESDSTPLETLDSSGSKVDPCAVLPRKMFWREKRKRGAAGTGNPTWASADCQVPIRPRARVDPVRDCQKSRGRSLVANAMIAAPEDRAEIAGRLVAEVVNRSRVGRTAKPRTEMTRRSPWRAHHPAPWRHHRRYCCRIPERRWPR